MLSQNLNTWRDPAGRGKANDRIRTDNPWFTKPDAENAKCLAETEVTQPSKNDLADFLASVVKKHPDLTKLIEAWPTLRPAIKQCILLIAEGPRDVAD